jgi:hypothetical protein
MPVRLLTQSLLRWPEAGEILQAVSSWAAELGADHPSLERVGVHGSYGRGDAGFGSDLDLVLIDAAAEGPQSRRYRAWPFETLPLSCDALVLTPTEWQALIRGGERDPARRAFARALQRDCRWLWSREAGSGDRHEAADLAGSVHGADHGQKPSRVRLELWGDDDGDHDQRLPVQGPLSGTDGPGGRHG